MSRIEGQSFSREDPITYVSKQIGDGLWGKRNIARQFVREAALGAFALATPGLVAERGAVAKTAPDSLHRRVRTELKVFTDWIAAKRSVVQAVRSRVAGLL